MAETSFDPFPGDYDSGAEYDGFVMERQQAEWQHEQASQGWESQEWHSAWAAETHGDLAWEQSAWEAPVIMFLMKSLWPGASMIV